MAQRKTINNKQKTLIHVAKNNLNLTDEIYRDILWNTAKVNTSKDLTYSGFLKILKRFRELGFRKTVGNQKQYEPSRKGLLEELTDAARERWGESFERPLNAFINSRLKTPTHYKFLNVTFMKAIKERLKEMNRQRDSSPSAQNDNVL